MEPLSGARPYAKTKPISHAEAISAPFYLSPVVPNMAGSTAASSKAPKDDQNGTVYEPYRNGDISYVGRECQSIPDRLVHAYAFAAVRLDLSFNRLCTIKGIEHFIQLTELVLDNNVLSDPSEFRFNSQLKTLSLNKNCFENLDFLISSIEQCYPTLTFLSLLGNPACPDQITNPDKDDDDYQRYRYYVIHKLRQLRFLDSRAITASERRESRRVGAFMKVARPRLYEAPTWAEEPEDANRFTPLPALSSGSQKKTVYGVLKYKYTGKHSEGNRFIRNDQL